MKEREIRVHLFGPLREAFGKASVTVRLPHGAAVRDLRRLLAARMESLGALLKSSAIADENGVLNEGAKLNGSSFRVLPPVAGG